MFFQTRILVTHGITYLPKVDQIIVVKQGTITEDGEFEELIDRNGDFSEFIRTYLSENTTDDINENLGSKYFVLLGNITMSDV